ncbi:HET-domain-containing protein [Alternaria alternata]|nr:HET-domain-containing protein [Alternaria alternata]
MSVSAAPTLCDRCSPMFQGSFLSTKEYLYDHHISIQSLEQAANKNCIICRDVWKGLVRRSGFDRETLCAEATRLGSVTAYSIDEGCVDVRCWLHVLGFQSYRYVETQRKSALQPSRVQTPCTNVK